MKRHAPLATVSALLLSAALAGQACASSTDVENGQTHDHLLAESASGMPASRNGLPWQTARFVSVESMYKAIAEAPTPALDASQGITMHLVYETKHTDIRKELAMLLARQAAMLTPLGFVLGCAERMLQPVGRAIFELWEQGARGRKNCPRQ